VVPICSFFRRSPAGIICSLLKHLIKAPGFSEFSQQVVLKQDKFEELKAKLMVSEASMGILIETDAPLVQTEATVSTTFERRMLDIPLSANGPNRGGPSPLHP
jgi:hypothetical protein